MMIIFHGKKRKTNGVESIMIKKRFTWKSEKLQHLNDEVLLVVDNENKEWKGHILNVVDLLNNLTEENEQLRYEIEIEKKWQLEKDNYYVKIKEENERLQKENNILNMNEDDLKECVLENIQLKEENEKLRNELNDCDFILCQDDFGNYEIRYDDDKIFHFLWEVAPILNKQQAIIQSLKEEVNKLNEELYYCEKFRYQVFQRLNELNED